jgi:hypothetical protein
MVTDVGRFYDRVTKIPIIHLFAIQVLKKSQFKLDSGAGTDGSVQHLPLKISALNM